MVHAAYSQHMTELTHFHSCIEKGYGNSTGVLAWRIQAAVYGAAQNDATEIYLVAAA